MISRRQLITGLATGAGLAADPWSVYGEAVSSGRAAGTSRVPKLKITVIKAARLNGLNRGFVRVYTDQGLTGSGEVLDQVGAEDIVNKHLGPAIKGRDPLDIEGIYWDFWSWMSPPGGIPAAFMRGMGGPYLAAISGIEMALWDLAGKAMDVPLYRLFGGRVREKIGVYFHATDPARATEVVQKTKVKAIKAIRLDAGTESDNRQMSYDPGKRYNWTLSNPEIDAFATRVAAIRQAIGPDIGLGLECHSRYDTESAIQLAKAVEQYRPMWLEEPVPSDNADAMAQVRHASRIPISCGENVYTRYGFRPFLEKQAVAIIQPDMAKCGGLMESRRIAAMAEVYHIPIAPHGMTSPLGETAFAHVCATVPNFMLLEWGQFFNDRLNALVVRPPVYQAGFLELPEAPGIGVELNDAMVKQVMLPGYEL